MIGKYFFGALAVAVLLSFASISAVAQVGELRGTVMMKQADGQKVPLADAQIDVFRTDIKGDYKTKTNKKGEWVFAGIPFVGTYVVAVSHPTASPNFMPGVRAGRGVPVELEVTPGDGKRLTFDDIKKAGGATAAPANPGTSGNTGGGGGGGESDADKAKREELLRKNKEIEEGNKKIEAANATIARTFKAGNEALTAANAAGKNSEVAIPKYTEAIAQFDEGLAADPEQPAILTNKAVALKGRGVQKYNTAVSSKTVDDAAKTALIEGAKADFKGAAEASSKAVTLIKAQPTPTDPAEVQRYNGNKYAALVTQAESMRLFVGKVDGTQSAAGVTAFKDYIAIETDPVKKVKAQLDLAQMLLDANQGDKALAEYEAILATAPDNADALFGAGMALYAQQDKAKYQDAANYLQKFVDKAPAGHQFKDEAKLILDDMKASQNVTPDKKAPPKRRP